MQWNNDAFNGYIMDGTILNEFLTPNGNYEQQLGNNSYTQNGQQQQEPWWIPGQYSFPDYLYDIEMSDDFDLARHNIDGQVIYDPMVHAILSNNSN
jgi:hypothetical protein